MDFTQLALALLRCGPHARNMHRRNKRRHDSRTFHRTRQPARVRPPVHHREMRAASRCHAGRLALGIKRRIHLTRRALHRTYRVGIDQAHPTKQMRSLQLHIVVQRSVQPRRADLPRAFA